MTKTYREHFLKEAKKALKDGLPITAKQHLKNAETLKNTPTFQELWEKKVNEGCIREGLPLRYPQAGTPLPTTKDVE